MAKHFKELISRVNGSIGGKGHYHTVLVKTQIDNNVLGRWSVCIHLATPPVGIKFTSAQVSTCKGIHYTSYMIAKNCKVMTPAMFEMRKGNY